MYDPDSPTNILNYPVPDMSVYSVAFIWFLIVLGFGVMLFVFPNFFMHLFSVRQTPTREKREEVESMSQTHSSPEYGYGYGKYRCVDDEVYDEVVYEAEPPVKRAAKPPAKPPVKPPVKITDSKVIEEAIGGLCSLGFSKTESKKVVNRACDGRVFTDAEELIKATLNRSNV